MALSNILLEYSKKVTQQLLNRYKKQTPQTPERTIKAYINRFEEIKDALDVDKRDIMKYSWSELEGTVDGFTSGKDKKTQGGLALSKLNLETDENFLGSQNNVYVFIGADKESCIKYSSGKPYCIGRDDDMNMYDTYRRQGGGGTPYFVFNENLPHPHRYSMVVIYAFMNGKYQVTDSKNDHTNERTFDSENEVLEFLKDEWEGTADLDFMRGNFTAVPLTLKDYYPNLEIEGDTLIHRGDINLSGMDLTEIPDPRQIMAG